MPRLKVPFIFLLAVLFLPGLPPAASTPTNAKAPTFGNTLLHHQKIAPPKVPYVSRNGLRQTTPAVRSVSSDSTAESGKGPDSDDNGFQGVGNAFLGGGLLLGAVALALVLSGNLEPQALSGPCGLASVAVWIISQVPQMLKNYRRRKAEDLSLDFLLLWTVGDLCNLAGCFLIDGTIFQRVLAVYCVLCNIVLLYQWWAYGRREDSPMSPASRLFWGSLTAGSGLGLVNVLLQGPSRAAIGVYLGWVSGAVYLLSRLPQIWQNHTTKQVDDLSPYLFILAAVGNLTYAASILAVSLAPDWIRMQAPFLAGSLGTVVFDAVLLAQIAAYRRRPSDDLPPDAPLAP